MESKTNTSKPGAIYQEPKKKVPMYLVALVITLSVVAILLGIKLYIDSRAHKEEMLYVEGEKQKLENELKGLIVEYDSLKTYNDSLADQLTAEQDKIRQLLKREASNTTKIKMYERELETLRKVMRSYIVQIDSLNTKNQELTAENVMVRQELHKVTSDYEDVSRQKEELSSTVKVAQQLIAKDISIVGLNRNSKETYKIKKIEKIRVCFTVEKNKVAKAGNKTIYLRIIRPDDVVLSSPEAGTFVYNGESLVFSAKRDLEYENADIEMCIYWDATEELIEGTYLISLYTEGYELVGSEPVILK
jgi:predicted nuclease with TOPRIM domain